MKIKLGSAMVAELSTNKQLSPSHEAAGRHSQKSQCTIYLFSMDVLDMAH